MEDEYYESPDTVSASALDVISCGLGAGVLLFLVLSAARASPSATGSVLNYIDVEFTVADTSAVLAPYVQPPGAHELIEIPFQSIDRVRGRFIPGAIKPSRPDMALLASAASSYEPLGFSLEGEIRAFDRDAGGKRHFRIHIAAPLPGIWRVAARYFNNERSGFVEKVRVDVLGLSRGKWPWRRSNDVGFGKFSDVFVVNIPITGAS